MSASSGGRQPDPSARTVPRVSLREVTERDLIVFFEHQLDPDATRMAAFPARHFDTHMAHWRRILVDEAVVARTVVADGAVAGNLVCWLQDGEREVGYWIGREFWGRGIATRALAAFLEVVRDRPLFAHVAIHNVASRRVLEKCGFEVVREDRREGSNELILRLDRPKRAA